jgi:Ser/Thr protein kinase RdoA (MazF antagonist)
MIPKNVKVAVAAAVGDADATVAMRTPQTHQSNQLYDVWVEGRHLIAKQYLKEDEWEEAPDREHRSLQLLQPLDIAPHPYFYDPAVGPIVLYEYMEGRMWGRYRPSTDELIALAEAMAQVHSLPTTGLWPARGSGWAVARRVAWFRQMLDNYAIWSAANFPPGRQVVSLCQPLIEAGGDLLERLEEEMPSLVFCRSDPRFANVIVRPDGRYGFVDWEDSGLRDPALEIADMTNHSEQEDLLTPAEWQSFLTSYRRLMGFDGESFELRVERYARIMPLFYLLILLQYGIRYHAAGRLADWQVNEMPGNLRLQRYLARALAKTQSDFDPAVYADVLFFPTS